MGWSDYRRYHSEPLQDIRYRQRYLDLITNEEVRDRFVVRAKAIQALREFMLSHDFLEVRARPLLLCQTFKTTLFDSDRH